MNKNQDAPDYLKQYRFSVLLWVVPTSCWSPSGQQDSPCVCWWWSVLLWCRADRPRLVVHLRRDEHVHIKKEQMILRYLLWELTVVSYVTFQWRVVSYLPCGRLAIVNVYMKVLMWSQIYIKGKQNLILCLFVWLTFALFLVFVDLRVFSCFVVTRCELVVLWCCPIKHPWEKNSVLNFWFVWNHCLFMINSTKKL